MLWELGTVLSVCNAHLAMQLVTYARLIMYERSNVACQTDTCHQCLDASQVADKVVCRLQSPNKLCSDHANAPACLLQDYLLAPMPYLVGVPAASLFTALHSTPLDEVMLVDLDSGTCTPGSSLPPAEPSSLPYAEELASALQVHFVQLKMAMGV